MTLRGIHGQRVGSGTTGPASEDVLGGESEVRGTLPPPVLGQPSLITPSVTPAPKPSGVTSISKVDGGQALGSQIAVVKAQNARSDGKLDRTIYREQLMRFGAAGYDRAAQADMSDLLAQHFPDKSGQAAPELRELAGILDDLRRVVPAAELERGPLADFFAERGFTRMQPSAELSWSPGYQLDRPKFTGAVQSLLAAPLDQDDKQTKRARAMVTGLYDGDDIQWAKHAITREVRAAKTGLDASAHADQIATIETRGAEVRAELETRQKGVPVMDVADALRDMRQSGFSAKSVKAYERLIKRHKGDPEVVFFAQRIAARSLEHARGVDGCSRGRKKYLERVGQRLDKTFAQRLEGCYDRRSEARHLRRLLNDNEITPAQYRALKAGAMTAGSRAEFGEAVAFARQELGLEADVAQQLYEAEESFENRFEGTDEERDIERRDVEQRRHEVEEGERQVTQRRIEAQRTAPAPEQRRAQARVLGHLLALRGALPQATSRAQRADLLRDYAAEQAAQADLAVPRSKP